MYNYEGIQRTDYYRMWCVHILRSKSIFSYKDTSWVKCHSGTHSGVHKVQKIPHQVCLGSKLCLVTKTQVGTDPWNDSSESMWETVLLSSRQTLSCTHIGCNSSLLALLITTHYTQQDLDSVTAPDILPARYFWGACDAVVLSLRPCHIAIVIDLRLLSAIS